MPGVHAHSNAVIHCCTGQLCADRPVVCAVIFHSSQQGLDHMILHISCCLMPVHVWTDTVSWILTKELLSYSCKRFDCSHACLSVPVVWISLNLGNKLQLMLCLRVTRI